MKKKYIAAVMLVMFAFCPVTALDIESEGLFPEGIAYDQSKDEFLITSLTKGRISRVTRKGKVTKFIEDKDLISAIGIELDSKNGRIIVCSSDPGVSEKTSKATQKKIAGMGVYDAKTGKKIKFMDLGKLNDGPNFANDIAVDVEGNIYITNSFSPVIYKVDKSYNASIFLQSDAFKGEGFALNGIDYHPEGFLLVAKSDTGKLFKVPVANPASFIEVDQSENLKGADGIVLIDQNQLAVISNAQKIIYILTTDDQWKSAELKNALTSPSLEFPTTGTLVKGEFYLLNAKLNQLFGGNKKVKKFEIYSIKDLQPVKK